MRPPEHPTDEMLAAGVRMHNTSRSGPDETLVHDIWQSMYDAWHAEASESTEVDIIFPGPDELARASIERVKDSKGRWVMRIGRRENSVIRALPDVA